MFFWLGRHLFYPVQHVYLCWHSLLKLYTALPRLVKTWLTCTGEVLIHFLNFVIWIKISCRKIKESLQEIIIIEVNSITRKERIKLEVLINNFSEKCPFTPLGVLDVNLSNAVSMAGLSFTYVIVLLQLQISDRYQTPNIYLNSTVT